MVLLPVTLFNGLTGSYIYHVIMLLNVCLDLKYRHVWTFHQDLLGVLQSEYNS